MPSRVRLINKTTKYSVVAELLIRLKLLVNEFSRFARMPEVQTRPDDIHKVIADVLTLYEGNLSNAKIQTALDESVPRTSIDVEQMKQVFRNLINNALEAASEFVTIDISTH